MASTVAIRPQKPSISALGADHAELGAGLEGHHAAGIPAQQFIAQPFFGDGAARVHEGSAVAGELLKNGALAAEQA